MSKTSDLFELLERKKTLQFRGQSQQRGQQKNKRFWTD